jgi:hypothetical protein
MGAMGGVGAVGAMGAVGGATLIEGCSTGMGRAVGGPDPAVTEPVMETGRPSDDISEGC